MIEHNVLAGNFDGLTSDYERYRVGYSAQLFTALESLGFRRDMTVLDAGCGTGISMQPLIARGMVVTGFDPSPEMLAAAKGHLPDATFVEAGAEAIPFADRSFGGAVSAQAFHWFDKDKAFAELIRVVEPGGPIAIWWKLLSADDALRALRAAACARVGIEPSRDALSGGFGAFYRAPFANRSLRVIPFTARFIAADWIGYERSRASARNAYGTKCDAYFDALQSELVAKYGSLEARIDVRYVQYLYVGTTATA